MSSEHHAAERGHAAPPKQSHHVAGRAGAQSVRALVYHTVDHQAVHLEGEKYLVDDPALFETLLALGFAEFVPPDPQR